jgi:DNA mismatch repair protein MutL
MGKIHIGSAEWISKFAARGIIEHPASVVKELIENALDASSTEIKVEVIAGGRKLIQVTDNGEGMTPEDATATSFPD